MIIHNIFSIKQAKSRYEASIELIFFWEDYRLSFVNDPLITKEKVDATRYKTKLWTPRYVIEDLYKENVLEERYILYRSGIVVYHALLGVEIGCHYDFTDIPFDWQKCHI
jgi:hypothetical protein